MATRFLKINDEFRDSLEETLDKNNHSGKVRHIIMEFLTKIKSYLCHCAVDVLKVIQFQFIIQETKLDLGLISAK